MRYQLGSETGTYRYHSGERHCLIQLPPQRMRHGSITRVLTVIRGRAVSAVVVLALSTAACRDGATPGVPSRAAVSAEVNAVPAPPPAPPAPVVSRFDVPLSYDFTQVLSTVERVVPTTFGSLSDVKAMGSGDRKHYAYVATRGPFTAFAQGGEVHLRTTLTYTARGSYKPPIGPTLSATCGDGGERPRIIAELVAPVTLTSNWHLRSKARIATLAAASTDDRDRCRLSFLSVDVTDRVLDAARKGIEARLGAIDAKVAAVDLTTRATGWWTHLNAPIRLADGVWLLLQPEQLRLKSVRGEGHTLTVAAGLDAFPLVVTGARPVRAVPALPPLGNDTGTAGFRVALEGTIDYASASRALTSQLRGKTVAIASRSVRVGAVIASRRSDGRLALTVAFSGDAVGDAQFVGTPRVNRATDQIVVSDLDFDLATNNALLNAYAWLRSDVLLAFFRERARVPSAPVIAQGTRLIELGLNRTIKGVLTLAGRVDSLQVLGVYVEPRGLTVRALVTGDASVAVRPKRALASTRGG